MMNYEKMKEFLKDQKDSLQVPESRADLINTVLVLMVCEKLEALEVVLKDIKESLPKNTVVTPGKPGRKPKSEESGE